MTRFTLGACLLAASSILAFPPIVGAQESWNELQGARFVLQGKGSIDQLRDVACDVELAARAIRSPVDSRVVPHVVATGSAGEMRELLPQFWESRGPRPFGAYWSGPFGHHIAVRVDARPDERLRRVLHEYAHFVARLTYREPPRWLDEGLAEYFETTIVEKGEIRIGGPATQHLKLLRSTKGWIPLPELIAATELPSNGRQLSQFYAQSWALVHYLAAAANGPFGIRPAQADLPTDDQLRAYFREPLAQVTMALGDRSGGCASKDAERRLSTGETVIAKAKALADGPRPEAALPLLRPVSERAPVAPEAMEVLGFVQFTENRAVEAAAAFDQAIKAGAASHVAYYYRGLLAAQVPRLADGSGVVSEADYLRRAISLNPAFEPARERLKAITSPK